MSDQSGDDYCDFSGPCEQPPSPFTLTYDGVEWEEGTPETLEFDHCDEDGPSLMCWHDEWDWEDDDGEPEHWMWMPSDYCEDMGTHWECESPWMVMPEHGWKSVPTEWITRTRGIGDQLLHILLRQVFAEAWSFSDVVWMIILIFQNKKDIKNQ